MLGFEQRACLFMKKLDNDEKNVVGSEAEMRGQLATNRKGC
jgi:hypothetical protein